MGQAEEPRLPFRPPVTVSRGLLRSAQLRGCSAAVPRDVMSAVLRWGRGRKGPQTQTPAWVALAFLFHQSPREKKHVRRTVRNSVVGTVVVLNPPTEYTTTESGAGALEIRAARLSGGATQVAPKASSGPGGHYSAEKWGCRGKSLWK